MRAPVLLLPNPFLLPTSQIVPSQAYTMTSSNGLICFTNCLIPLEDGSLVDKDLWIDERRGIVLDSQVKNKCYRACVPGSDTPCDGSVPFS